MLRTDARPDVQHRLIGLDRRDPTIRDEHRSEFETDEPLDPRADGREGLDPAVVVERVEPVRWEDHRCAATARDGLARFEIAIEVEDRAGLVGHVGAGDEVRAGDGRRSVEDLDLLGVGQQLDVPGVHVDRWRQARRDGTADVSLGGVPVDLAAGGERQQHGRHPGDRVPRLDSPNHVGFGHGTSCAVIRSSKSAAAGGTTDVSSTTGGAVRGDA